MSNKHSYVLLVDDNQNLLVTLGEILKVRGFEPVLAQTGGAALKHIEGREIDVALIDLKLEDMPGLEVLRGIKAHSPECECILLTGNASQDSAIQAVQMGAYGYFQKPFDVEQVILSVQRAADKHQSTLALRASAEKFRTIADFTYDWEIWLNPQQQLVYVSPACERISGYRPQEFISDTRLMERIVHPNDREIWDQHLSLHDGEESIGSLDEAVFRIIRRDGETRWIEHVCRAVHDADGKYLGRRASNRDITERKQAEEALRKSQELFSLFMRHSPIYTFIKVVTPTESRVLQASDNYQQMIGISGRDMVGKNMAELFPAEFAAKITADDWAVITNGEVLKLDEELNGRNYTSIKFPIIQGDKTLLAGYTIDITERKQAEDELRTMKEALESANRELQTALAREKELAYTDVLTGINNRRYLFELAERTLETAARYRQPLSVVMFDIDHFKSVNDTFGHAVGDQILQRITQIACAELRAADVIGRYGGEEFIILLPMTSAQQAYPLAERIRADVAELRVPTPKGNASATLSIGIVEMIHTSSAQHAGGVESVENAFRRADAAMYAAKQAGRNRIVISDLE